MNAIESAADVRRCLGHPDGQLGNRPRADLGAGDLREPLQRAQLGIAIDAIFRGLADAGGDPGSLQLIHHVESVEVPGP